MQKIVDISGWNSSIKHLQLEKIYQILWLTLLKGGTGNMNSNILAYHRIR